MVCALGAASCRNLVPEGVMNHQYPCRGKSDVKLGMSHREGVGLGYLGLGDQLLQIIPILPYPLASH